MGKYNPKEHADYEPDVALDPGWYTWRIVNQQEDVSKKNSNAMLILDLVCTDGPEQKSGRSCVGYETRTWLLLEYAGMSERGRHMSEGYLVSLINAADFSKTKQTEWDELIDVEVEAKTKVDIFEGEKSTKIVKFRAVTNNDYQVEDDE